MKKVAVMVFLFLITLVSKPVLAESYFDQLASKGDKYIWLGMNQDGSYYASVGKGPHIEKDFDSAVAKIAEPQDPNFKISFSDFLGVDEIVAAKFKSLLKPGISFSFYPAHGAIAMYDNSA